MHCSTRCGWNSSRLNQHGAKPSVSGSGHRGGGAELRQTHHLWGDSTALPTLAGLWALLSLFPACYRSRLLCEASSGRVPLCTEFQQLHCEPQNCHFTLPNWEDTAEQAAVFPKDKERNFTEHSQLPSPARIPTIMMITLRRCAAEDLQTTVIASRDLWTVCNLQTEQEVKVSSVIGCCEPFADPCRGVMQSVADTIQSSLSDPAEGPCGPLCYRTDSDPFGVTVDKVCLGFIVTL